MTLSFSIHEDNRLIFEVLDSRNGSPNNVTRTRLEEKPVARSRLLLETTHSQKKNTAN